MSRLRTAKYARLVAEIGTKAAVARGLEKRRQRGFVCPLCGKDCKGPARLTHHLLRPSCAPPERPNVTIDPWRPELGKVPKGSLLWKILNGD